MLPENSPSVVSLCSLEEENVSSLMEWRMASLVEEYLGAFPHVMWVEDIVSSLVEE